MGYGWNAPGNALHLQHVRIDTVSRISLAALPILVFGLVSVCVSAEAPVSFFHIRDVKPGLHGVGRTVFNGDKIEEFQVEILGVLENIGPKQNLILAKLSGGPLEHTGVMQGMSGSPVYIDGKLLGAVAMAFPFAKDPIAGIRPIEEMLRVNDNGSDPTRQRVSFPQAAPHAINASLLPKPELEEVMAGGNRMIDIATPLSFGGFTDSAVAHFATELKSLGLEPRQGVSMGGRVLDKLGDPSQVKPGSMISVELMTGDMSVGADGTVTYVDGSKVYAFGHHFMSVGTTGLPFTHSEVLTLLPNLNSSFKISSPRELMGVISQDRNTAIAGTLGARAAMTPVDINVSRAGRTLDQYHIRMVNDRFLGPFLLQMAVFSAIDATERTVGAASLTLKGSIQLEGGREAIRLGDVYAADTGTAALASLSAAIPLAYVLQGGFDGLRVKSIALDIEASDGKKALQIDQVLASRHEVHPGETVEIETLMTGENDVEITRSVRYQVPVGTNPGTLYFTVADSSQTNILELRQSVSTPARSAQQLIDVANRLRSNNKAYVRVWRSEAVYSAGGEDFPDAPPSAALILSGGTPSLNRNAKIAEMEIDGAGMSVSGSKTVQVEVKE
jgi:hypothetical protein